MTIITNSFTKIDQLDGFRILTVNKNFDKTPVQLFPNFTSHYLIAQTTCLFLKNISGPVFITRLSFISLSYTEEAVDGKDDADDAEDSDSDNEDDNDVTDGYNNNNNNNNNDETKEKHDDDDDHGFFGRFFEALVDKLAVFKTRAGRAGLVHNFLRGLQVMTTAPLLSGLLLSIALFLYFFMNA